jgi:hypothetical protein
VQYGTLVLLYSAVLRNRTSIETLHAVTFPELYYKDSLFAAGLDKHSVHHKSIVSTQLM